MLPSIGDVVICVSCGGFIGTLVAVKDQFWLKAGGVEVKYLHGRCAHCNKIFHFDCADQKLNELIQRMKKHKQFQ